MERQGARPRDHRLLFHVAILDPSPETIAEIPRIVERGVTSFKIFMMQGFEARARDFLRAFKAAGDSGALLAIHAEDEHLIGFCTERLLAAGNEGVKHFAASRPPLSEAAAVRRALAMTELSARPPTSCTCRVAKLSMKSVARAPAAASCSPRRAPSICI